MQTRPQFTNMCSVYEQSRFYLAKMPHSCLIQEKINTVCWVSVDTFDLIVIERLSNDNYKALVSS